MDKDGAVVLREMKSDLMADLNAAAVIAKRVVK